MSTPNLPSGHHSGAQPFRVVLTPYRSLTPTGFLILMVGIGTVSFIAGMAFLMMGAWPVFGFFGLDVALVYYAFRKNYQSGRCYEVIEFDSDHMSLVQVDSSGASRCSKFNPHWVAVRLKQASDGRTSLALASHGRETEFATFLTDDERVELADALGGALVAARGGARI